MELYDFIRYDHTQRAASVFDSGQFLLMHKRKQHHVALYDMGKFFAEIWYNSDLNSIDLVRGFKNDSQLAPYLNAVDISQLTGD